MHHPHSNECSERLFGSIGNTISFQPIESHSYLLAIGYHIMNFVFVRCNHYYDRRGLLLFVEWRIDEWRDWLSWRPEKDLYVVESSRRSVM